MASPEKLTPLLPETLPEDFNDWDGDASPMPAAGKAVEWEAWDATPSFGKPSKPLSHSADRDALLPPVAETPRVSGSAPHAPVLVKSQRDRVDWEKEAPAALRPPAKPAPASAAAPVPELATPAPPSLAPVERNEWEAFQAPPGFDQSRKPIAHIDDREAMSPPVVEMPKPSASASPSLVPPKQQKAPTEWDSEASLSSELGPAPRLAPAVPQPEPAPTAASAPAPDIRDEWEAFQDPHFFDKPAKPLAQSAERDAMLPPVVERPRASASAAPAPPPVKPAKDPSDWEKEAAAATSSRNEWEAFQSPQSHAKPPLTNGHSAGHSAGRDAMLPPVPAKPPAADMPRVAPQASPAPVAQKPLNGSPSAKPQKLADSVVAPSFGRASRASEAAYTLSEVPSAPGRSAVFPVGGARQTPELAAAATANPQAGVAGLFHSFRSLDVEAEGGKKEITKKWAKVAGISAGAILIPLILLSMLFHHGSKTPAPQPVQQQTEATDTQQDSSAPAPPAAQPSTDNRTPAATAKQPAAEQQPAAKNEVTNAPQVQSKMMHDQLAAPTQIPQDAKNQASENEPPPASLASVASDGLGASDMGGVFNGQAKPVVKSSKPVAISAGVATGLLIQKSPPIYPAIAKSARVSGTVVLEATISATGTIKDLRVVSGPAMLRQSAVDAVRTWRYKPYKLNNQPVEVQATINVVFSLNG